MDLRLADRVQALEQSEIRRFSAWCASIGGVNLSQGVCDQPAPDEVKAGAKAAIDADQATYTHMRGIRELREAIAVKMERFNGIKADPEKEIAVTVGTAAAFASTVLTLMNPGDEAIVFSPYYSYHVNLLRLFGNNIRFVDTQPPDWRYERIDFPLPFAPELRYTGVAELRFAPGMFDAAMMVGAFSPIGVICEAMWSEGTNLAPGVVFQILTGLAGGYFGFRSIRRLRSRRSRLDTVT